MKRSDFLKAFGLGTTGLIIPNTNWAQKSIKIYDNYIKGLVHYQFQGVKLQIAIGQELMLKREVTNIYDRYRYYLTYLQIHLV